MSMSLALPGAHVQRLDYGLLSRAFLAIGIGLAMAAPLSPDPLAFVGGALVPGLVLWICGSPTLPAAAAFFFLWQWLQVFARALVGLVDGEAMSRSLYGVWVEEAYWYSLAGIVTLAVAFRLVLRVPPPAESYRVAHLKWRSVDAFYLYLAAYVFNLFAQYAYRVVPGVYQQLNALGQFKVAAMFMLFVVVLSSGQGIRFLLVAVAIEIVMGFSALLSDFRGVFIILALAALGARIRWTGAATAAATGWAAILIVLALFWTTVKQDYRSFATGGAEESQALSMPIEERLAYMGGKVLSVGDIDWKIASYILLIRLAYVDIFGSVIGVDKFGRDHTPMRQWSDALSHATMPRALFPGKAELSDTEVYVRLAMADPNETYRLNTSISVGYLAENYADLGFPGMLGGVFVIGIMLAGVCRYFMTRAVPWLLREATVMAFIYATCLNGIEISLPKIFGAAFMFFIVYIPVVKFGYPALVRWLDTRAGVDAGTFSAYEPPPEAQRRRAIAPSSRGGGPLYPS